MTLVAATIGRARLKLDMSQFELGLAVGVRAKTVSAWELARTVPPHRYIPALEDALGIALDIDPALRRRYNQKRRGGHKLIDAFGETKSIARWARDPRCVVIVGTLFDRLDFGWEPERAITTPAATKLWFNPTCRAPGCNVRSHDIGLCGMHARRYRTHGDFATVLPKLGHVPRWVYFGFGEWRTMPEWARDPRCVVAFNTFRARVEIADWDIERALLTPSRNRPKTTERSTR